MSRTSESARRQLERIIALGYPQVAGMSAEAFRALAAPLLGALDSVDVDEEVLLVPTSELVSPDSLIARTSIGRNAGFSTMPPRPRVDLKRRPTSVPTNWQLRTEIFLTPPLISEPTTKPP